MQKKVARNSSCKQSNKQENAHKVSRKQARKYAGKKQVTIKGSKQKVAKSLTKMYSRKVVTNKARMYETRVAMH